MYINEKLDDFKKGIKDKRVAVIGIGVSNIPAIKYLVSLGAKVTARDKKENLGPECEELKLLGVEFILGQDYLNNLDNYDYIFRSPGVKPFDKNIVDAVNRGVILTSEIELLISLCNCKVIGITGSDGKTTTTTLVYKFLKEAGFNVWLGGNIGYPIFSKLDEIKSDDIVVLELSSFQLMTLKESPSIAIITNISPNHLDYHNSFEEYVDSKANIFINQSNEDIIVFNKDNSFTQKYLQEISNRNIDNEIREFSVVEDVKNGVYLENGFIVANFDGNKEQICNISEVKLVGIHNLANICAAATAVYDISGKESIKKVVSSFNGVEHRMELTRVINGVKWYNDSIGTSPSRTIAGLVSFDRKIILIAGGYDKNIPYDEIGSYIIDKVKVLLLIGKTGPKIEKAVLDEARNRNINIDNYTKIYNFETLEECVDYAYRTANNLDIVVLSPASASFDMYKNFEQRGDHFKSLVNNL